MEERAFADKAQMQAVLAGDEQASRSLIQQHQRLVSHIVFRMVANEADRQDLCQEVFLKVFRNLAEFRYRSKLSTWIARIAYHTCLNYLEKKRACLYEDIVPESRLIAAVGEYGHSPLDHTEAVDVADRLQEEISRLPIPFRTVLTLFHLDGMRYREIVEITGMPEGTVKSYLFRARKLLKDQLISKYQREDLGA